MPGSMPSRKIKKKKGSKKGNASTVTGEVQLKPQVTIENNSEPEGKILNHLKSMPEGKA